MISPWLLRFIFITIGPMAASFYFSFTDYQILSAPSWIGIKNYTAMITDDTLFLKTIGNTLYYVGFSVPLNVMAAFAIAMVFNQKLKGVRAYRTMIYLPALMPAVASSVLWKWMFNSQTGMSALIFGLFGMKSPNWFNNPVLAKPALIVMALWSVGPAATIFLAGLQGIPSELYEVARIDGARAPRMFFSITLPMMSPVLLFNLVMGIITSFQVFTPAYIITQGGPMNATNFFMFHLYRQGFQFFQMGYASALSWVLFFFILLLTLTIFRSSRGWVFYQGAQ
jgi:multiple sugar transport system permease protein